MMKYMAQTHWPKIAEIEVEKETAASVWIKGRRIAKTSHYKNYFSTWEEAHDWLLAEAQKRLDGARNRLQQAQGFMGNVKGMKHTESTKGTRSVG